MARVQSAVLSERRSLATQPHRSAALPTQPHRSAALSTQPHFAPTLLTYSHPTAGNLNAVHNTVHYNCLYKILFVGMS